MSQVASLRLVCNEAEVEQGCNLLSTESRWALTTGLCLCSKTKLYLFFVFGVVQMFCSFYNYVILQTLKHLLKTMYSMCLHQIPKSPTSNNISFFCFFYCHCYLAWLVGDVFYSCPAHKLVCLEWALGMFTAAGTVY